VKPLIVISGRGIEYPQSVELVTDPPSASTAPLFSTTTTEPLASVVFEKLKLPSQASPLQVKEEPSSPEKDKVVVPSASYSYENVTSAGK